VPWLNCDDGEADAPWVWEVGNEAYGVYVRLAGYCAKHLTNGVVPMGVALGYAGGKKPLLTLELHRRVEIRGDRERPTSVFLPFYLDANRSREQIEADREAAATRKARWRASRNGSGHA
jgi:hypothetical protein